MDRQEKVTLLVDMIAERRGDWLAALEELEYMALSAESGE